MNLNLRKGSNPRLRIASLVLFIAIWQLAAIVVERQLLPGPQQVFFSIVDHLGQGELIFHLSTTLARVVVSFICAMALGVALGIVMGRNRNWDAALDGMLVLALNLPALVTIILCYLWFGLGEFAAILAVAINKFPVVVVNMREGARGRSGFVAGCKSLPARLAQALVQGLPAAVIPLSTRVGALRTGTGMEDSAGRRIVGAQQRRGVPAGYLFPVLRYHQHSGL